MQLERLVLIAIFLCLILVNSIKINELDIVAKKITSENTTDKCY